MRRLSICLIYSGALVFILVTLPTRVTVEARRQRECFDYRGLQYTEEVHATGSQQLFKRFNMIIEIDLDYGNKFDYTQIQTKSSLLRPRPAQTIQQILALSHVARIVRGRH